MARYSAAQVARLVDHTLLKPEAGPDDVAALVAEAAELGAFAACVSPSMVAAAVAARRDSPVAARRDSPVAARRDSPVAARRDGVVIAAVAGFPSGKHLTAVKADEAARAVADGAAEIDMVIDVGSALAADFAAVRADIAGVRAAVPGATLKVIVESAALLSLRGGGSAVLTGVCRAAQDAGADFVKTSTGFHPSGGASVRAVEIMAAAVGGRLGVKASGGIRTADDAVAMLRAGATRLGLSGTREVLAGLRS